MKDWCFDSVPAQAVELLFELGQRTDLARFALAGGTSLALRFGHRVSVDLDFFTPDSFDPEVLREALGEDCKELNRSSGSLSTVLGTTKVDFLRHDYPILNAVEEPKGFRIYSVHDVAAMKLNALANRGSKKDFYDIVELLEHADLSDWLDCFAAKYRKSDRFTVIRSLTWFEDADCEPDPVSNRFLTWNEVKARVVAAVTQL